MVPAQFFLVTHIPVPMFEETKIMKKKRTISLGNHFEKFIDQKVKSGRYKSPGEVIRSSLRLFERHEKRASNMEDEDFDPIQFMQEIEDELQLEQDLQDRHKHRPF